MFKKISFAQKKRPFKISQPFFSSSCFAKIYVKCLMSESLGVPSIKCDLTPSLAYIKWTLNVLGQRLSEYFPLSLQGSHCRSQFILFLSCNLQLFLTTFLPLGYRWSRWSETWSFKTKFKAYLCIQHVMKEVK